MSRAFFDGLARAASARYPRGDRFARHFAYGKLRGDPVFAHVLQEGLVADGASLLDLGCGQGLLGALLLAARESNTRGEWPSDWAPPPAAFRLRGVEQDAKDVERARASGAAETRYDRGDIRDIDFERADLVTLLDVLHYVDGESQGRILERVREAMPAGGTLLLRVANADGSLRFRITESLDRAAMRLRGRRVGKLHSRPLPEWTGMLEALGFSVREAPMSEGTPFANVLLVARYDPARS